jgi:hypothetical protein
MKRHRVVRSLLFFILCLACALRASAHRLDEYLQATRISVDRDRLSLELSLTPGVSLAPLVFFWIDTDHDGHISRREGAAYAQQVLDSLQLDVDDRPLSVTLLDQHFPEFHEMSLGEGVVRLRAAAKLTGIGDGNHRVVYRNTHKSEWSVYLANALVPEDDHIEIVEQHRDSAQRELAIDYRVIPRAQRTSSPRFLAVLAIACLFGVSKALPRIARTTRI